MGVKQCIARVCLRKLRLANVDDVDVRCLGPGYWFGVGAALTFARFLLNGVPETASYYAHIYGDFVRVWIGGVPTYLTTRLCDLKTVHSTVSFLIIHVIAARSSRFIAIFQTKLHFSKI